MGVDAGDLAHFTIIERRGLEPRRLVHAAVVDSHRMVEYGARLRNAFGVHAAVVDSKPLRVEARDIAAQAPYSTWLLDFNASEVPTEKLGQHENLRFKRALIGRDEMIDSLVDLFTMDPPGMLLPKMTQGTEDTLKLVRLHLRNLKKEVVKSTTGIKHRYRRDVENHFGFSIGMAVLAERLGGLYGPRWAPVRTAAAPEPALREPVFYPIAYGYLV